ncbi:MAG: pilus assembly protein [Caulobacteraceae bacterium]|nr:pilus assembly protein [Caulobacteraceae bacterium]
MKRFAYSQRQSLRQLWRDRRGATAVTVGLFMTLMIGMAGFVIDLGHVMYVQRQLQASADSAALAGAGQLNCCSPSIAASTANVYSAAWSSSSAVGSNKNADSKLYVQMASGYPKLKCFSSITTSVPCTGTDNANGVVVKQTATVPMWFAGVFGLSSIQVDATATAAGGGGSTGGSGSSSGNGNWDIEVIMDTTASMNNNDAACGKTRIACALSGLQLLLTKISPSADYVGVMAFPPLSSASQQSHDTACPSSNPTTTAYKNAVATGPTGSQPATYQIVSMSHDYQTSTQGQLNTSSSLVVAAGGASCSGLQSPGGFSTFYADAVKAAQTDITNNGRGSSANKAIIILSDGDANASTTNTTATQHPNQCTQAVTNAAAAKAAGFKVITVAYGAATSGSCSTDTGSNATSACATMKNMASDPMYFYSDKANGCAATDPNNVNTTSLSSIFSSIAQKLFVAPRLIPNSTT